MADTAPVHSPVFRSGLGVGADWGACVTTALAELGPLPEGANLGFVYVTDALAPDLASLLTFLREKTGVADWVGNVGLGVATCGRESHEVPALAVMVAALPAESFRVFEPVAAGAAEGGLESFRRAHGEWLARQRPHFGIAHGDPRNAALTDILQDLAAESGAYFLGGLSGARDAFAQVAGRVTEGGLSGVLFSPELSVVAGLSQGCSPLGPRREITAAEQNVVMEIDNRPALEVFKEDIGELLAHDLRRVAGYITVAFPVPGSDTGDYLVRSLTAIDPEKGWIAVGELVEPGRTLMFCRRDHEAAVADLRRMLRDVKTRAGTAPKGGVYVSCIARGPHLFGADSAELRLLREELGDFPLVGFYANGEICNDRLYGYTGVLALFL